MLTETNRLKSEQPVKSEIYTELQGNQRGDRDTWKSIISWMQKTQGLWLFDSQTEDVILTYLAENYPLGKSSRRRNLPPSDMPQIN